MSIAMTPLLLLISVLALVASAGAEGDQVNLANGASQQVRYGERLRAAGHLPEAEAVLMRAREVAAAGDQSLVYLAATELLAEVLLARRNYGEAGERFREVLAKSSATPMLASAAALGLGATQAAAGDTEASRARYREALDYARAASDPGLAASALARLAGLSTGDPEAALALLRRAAASADRIEAGRERATSRLEIADTAGELATPGGRELAGELLAKARVEAADSRDPRLLSLAAGSLAERRYAAGDPDGALPLLTDAIQSAASYDGRDLLLRWEWLLGRILADQGDLAGATGAYRRAVEHIEAIRQDIPVQYRQGRSTFRDTLAPIYLGLADLLLRQAPSADDAGRQALLLEARDTVERTKASELRDYFGDTCLIARRESVATLGTGTAVLYPVVLPDRLELLMGVGSQLIQRTSKVAAKRFDRLVYAAVGSLRPGMDGRIPAYRIGVAKALYDLMIKPFEADLAAAKVDTLVLVPDGSLRLLPIAALWDGKQFLAERFATATVPGLTLFDPQPLNPVAGSTLLAGLSRPGPVVDDLPQSLWDTLTSDLRGTPTSAGIRGLPRLRSADLRGSGDVTRDASLSVQVQDRLALPGVRKEIDNLARQSTSTVLLDQQFTLDSFGAELGDKPYRIVHIASHGFFGGEPEQNFIMTYDRRLDMDTLASLLLPKQFDEQPVELLTLSACQTAEGDDRSPLGISGIALRSGARATLGSLWSVSDEATQELLPRFFQELPKTTKAKALQAAQGELIRQDRYRHPFFWSAFVLVGNWL